MKITETIEKKKHPIRILQFGEGNFLRAFMEEFVEDANEDGYYDGSICVVKPRPGGSLAAFRKQNCIYTLVIQGLKDNRPFHEEKRITAIDTILHGHDDYGAFLKTASLPELQVIVSNTTEAGITVNEREDMDHRPPETYPAKLTRFLYERFLRFKGEPGKGLLILPLELNEANGALLKRAVLAYIKQWKLPDSFKNWIENCNSFCNTLVDRIVSGYGKADLPYEDKLIDICEPYCFFAIETREQERIKEQFPMAANNPAIILTEDLSIYRERKVKILNGIHTAVSMAAYHAGYQYVREFMEDEVFLQWIKQMIWQEMIPTIQMDRDELSAYAQETLQRFQNPFLDHRLLDISMNSVKKWQVRILPTIVQYKKTTGTLPEGLTFSLAALIFFYQQGARGNYPVKDDPQVIRCISSASGVAEILQSSELWGENLIFMEKLVSATEDNLRLIQERGIKGAIETKCR